MLSLMNRMNRMTRMNRAQSLAVSALAAIVLFVTGCGSGLIAFTQEIRDQHGLTNDELKNLQWYVSHKITLRRELESGSRQITGNHKLLLVSGKSIEEVVVEEHTPGIAVAVGDHSISVSFEQGSSLEFAAQSGTLSPSLGRSFAEPPDPFPGNNPDRNEGAPVDRVAPPGLFTGNYFLLIEPGGRLTFQSKPFEPVDESFQAHLMIDSESLDEVVKNRKVLPGLRLPSK